MPVISLVSPKGGAGKTTASVVLAGEFAQTGEEVTIIDADPNTPVVTWAARPNKPNNIKVITDKSEETILDNIKEASKTSKLVIVDLEGTANMRVTYAISQSDLVLIPVKPSMLDAKEAAKAISLVRRTEDMSSRKIPYAVIFSQMPAALVTKNFKDIAIQFQRLDVPVLDVQMIDREAYRTIFSIGGTIHTLTDKQVGGLEAARANALSFAQAVIGRLKSKQIAAA
ncbi:MAG: chromosome partitioning protein [Legionellaceae bacterium]|nr:chromosome partitioning protein [Legionellaceae bacterium]